MLAKIVAHTPPWVFILFFVLILYGYSQIKPRTIARFKITILPAVMIMLSLFGVISTFRFSIIGIILWLAGIALTVLVGMYGGKMRGVTYSEESQNFFVPGSWVPLLLMMAIFFTKYAVGVVMAQKLPFTATILFCAITSLVYGLLSGLFISRAIRIWNVRKQ